MAIKNVAVPVRGAGCIAVQTAEDALEAIRLLSP